MCVCVCVFFDLMSIHYLRDCVRPCERAHGCSAFASACISHSIRVCARNPAITCTRLQENGTTGCAPDGKVSSASKPPTSLPRPHRPPRPSRAIARRATGPLAASACVCTATARANRCWTGRVRGMRAVAWDRATPWPA